MNNKSLSRRFRTKRAVVSSLLVNMGHGKVGLSQDDFHLKFRVFVVFGATVNLRSSHVMGNQNYPPKSRFGGFQTSFLSYLVSGKSFACC